MIRQDSNNQDFQHVRIVEASAGSGKTYVLAKRYVQLLIDPRFSFSKMPFENVLAITFSNKATLEMKERILELLKKIALDIFTSKAQRQDILSSLGVSEDFACQRAGVIVDAILKNYNFFQVQTIDSFINTILCSCAYQLGLSANFKIKMDYREDLSYSLDALIDRVPYDQNIRDIFHKFLMQYIYLEEKTGWLPKKDINIIMDGLFKKRNSYGESFWRSSVFAGDLLLMKRAVLEKMRLLRDCLPQGTHVSFEKSLSAFLAVNRDAFNVNDVSNFFGREVFPITKKGRKTAQTDELWHQIRQSLRQICEAESCSVFDSYIDIFYEMLKELQALCTKEDVLFVQELSSRAKVLFSEGAITVAELYYRMAARVRHFLIDEFQDTSRLQWHNLFLLIEEALSSGGSLFYVGDKKQAIYRFRGGDAELFDSVRADFSAFHLGLATLNTNYRSRSNIVDFCNEMFSENNLRRFLRDCADSNSKAAVVGNFAQDKMINIFKGGAQNSVLGLSGGYVKVDSFDCDDKDERDSQIKTRFFALFDDLKERFDCGDIAVLARDNDKVELLTQWLLEYGVAVESEKTLNIRNNPYIKEVISFLKFLNSPIDDLAFASFILGDIFSKASAVDTRLFSDFIFGLRQKQSWQKKNYLYREFRLQFPSLWEEFLEPFFKNVGFVPVYELTVSIYAKFLCLENFPLYQGFFMKLLELIKDEEESSFSLAQFLEFFDQAGQEKLYVSASDMNSVKVLTIHKAKGLGFGVVVIPFFEMNVRLETDVVSLQNGELVLRRINEKYKMFSPSLEEIGSQEYYRSFVDELNNIYVALTRAKNELYIFVSKKTRGRANLASLFMPQEVFEKGNRQDYRKNASDVLKQSVFSLGVSYHQDWVHYLKDEFADVDILKNRDKILAGEIIHGILAKIGCCCDHDWQDILRASLETTLLDFPGVEDLKEFERVVAGLLTDEKFRPYFFCGSAQVYQEKEVIDGQARMKRLDRLIVGADYVWVVDYKSSRDLLGRDKEQIKEYLEIVAGLYPQKTITGVLIYLDDLSMEEVYG
ncbi:MAG: UvrD-helicase domain-containing protein [Candidatus Omnitrophota bacterium]